MKNIIDYMKLIQKNAKDMSGVFTYCDLASITNTSDKSLLPRRINQLETSGVLKKFVRGFYIYPSEVNLEVLSQRLFERSYLSLETVLAKNLVIGTVPEYKISAVKVGRSKLYESTDFSIEHLGLKPELFFGYQVINGINVADSEKAFLDCLYFNQWGRKLIFNVYEDINLNRLDQTKIKDYLTRYKNPKFIAFVKTVLSGVS